MHYDAFLFVQTIRTRFWLGMLAAVDAALLAAERWPATRRRHGPVQQGTDAEFTRFLADTRDYLVSEGRMRPKDMADDQFLLLKPLCESLVQQGRFPHARLDLFVGLDLWNVRPAPESNQPEANPLKRSGE